jgi:iron(III) transport system substrate-binding protein
VYNQSLVAAMIAELGPERTEAVVRGWVENLAVQPFANDIMAMEALLAGQCDVTLVNTYYYGSLQQQYAAAGRSFPLGLFWADQQGRGTHINISGAGVTRHAPHPEAAKALLEWLTGVEAQNVLVALNQEYPVNPEATLTAQMQAWGGFKPDSLPVVELGRRQAEAVVLMDRAGWR